MPVSPEYVNRLRVERKARGWNQVDVARRAKVLQADVSLYERGLVPRSPVLRRLGRAFGVPPETIVEWIREPAEERCA